MGCLILLPVKDILWYSFWLILGLRELFLLFKVQLSVYSQLLLLRKSINVCSLLLLFSFKET